MSNAEAAALVEALAEALVVADRDGRIVVWNAAAERLFGWSADDALDRTLDLIIPPKQRSRHWGGYRWAMAARSSRYADDVLRVPALHRDGRRLSISFTVTLIRDEAEVTGVAGIIRDETERWEELQRARRHVALLDRPTNVLPL
ncbi:MAG: PAS domain S-box protein [Actinomycetota bacterium]|nr:PAS domain S-box protein [Actinomycetota bacterium]